MNIKLDDKKPVFYIEDWKEIFESKGFSVPCSEIEFYKTMENKKMSIKCVSDAIQKATNWDSDELDEECPSKRSKIDKFLKLYTVIYSSGEQGKAEIPVQEKVNVIVDSDDDSITLNEAQEFLFNHRNGLIKEDEKIRLNTPTLHDEMSVTANNNFKVQINIENISRKNVLILDNELENVIALGEIITQEGKDLIIIDKGNILFYAFENKTQFNFAVLEVRNGNFSGKIFYKPIKIQMNVIQKTEKVLCIDFGTSNTTAGSYRIKDEFSNEPELVKFVDSTQENRFVDYFPTVVYVEKCEDKDNIVYKFGFEAKKLEKKGGYETSASVFYEIKHWLIEDDSYDKEIQVCDENGNSIRVSKYDIVGTYLRHIISLAEDYFLVKFKELHFTAPVKMKYKFIKIIQTVLPEYNIVEDGIDEAGAILFDYVSGKFKEELSNEKSNFSKGDVAVIDCGGGTTDLATCSYAFLEPQGTGIGTISMNTKFSNGDFNFGGNNITYKIMQLVKIKIALGYGFITEDDYNKVFERSENDILQEADKLDYDGTLLYKDFLDLYQRCEEFIPTQFNNLSEDFFDDDKPKVKRNFYYLWHFAEQVKITFYREEKEVLKEDWDDAIQIMGGTKYNYLYKKNGDVLEQIESRLNALKISITDIRKIIFGDIYNLLNKILPQKEYEYYRLSGQSCKINLFNELLKEFIPGKKLRNKMTSNIERMDSLSLKKHCIDGSIRYMMYKRLNMNAELVSVPVLAERIYNISFADFNFEISAEDDEEKSLVFCLVKSELDEITVIVRDKDKVIRKINVSTKIEKGSGSTKYMTPDGVINALKEKSNDDSINWNATLTKLANFRIKDKDKVVFIVAVPAGNNDGYGFYIHFIRKTFEDNKEYYHVTDGKYYNYESTVSDFFDGKR